MFWLLVGRTLRQELSERKGQAEEGWEEGQGSNDRDSEQFRRVGKRGRAVVGATASPTTSADLIVTEVLLDGVLVGGLIDSRCTRTIVGPKIRINKKK